MRPATPPLALLLGLLALPAAAEPLRGLDVNPAEGEGLGAAFGAALALGAEATSIAIYWDDLETVAGTYSPGGQDGPAVANRYLPPSGLRFLLTFAVIDTVTDRRPPDLRGLAWDDPEVVRRFLLHAEAVLARLPDLDVAAALAVGNEADALLLTDEEAAAYARFLAAVAPRLRERRPGIPVGTELTFGGLLSDPARWAPALAASDALMVTYYPLDERFRVRPPEDVPGDVAAMLAVAGEKPLWLFEAGYPSGGCGGSQEGQAGFAAALLAATDRPEVAAVNWTFLTDPSEATLDRLVAYYRLGDDCFRRYLATLGLRDQAGEPKPAAAVWAGPPG